MKKFTEGQTVYYDAQQDPGRPVRARVICALPNRQYRVEALWCIDPVLGEETGTILGYVYDLPAAHLRTGWQRRRRA